ncbi:hypothetical protein JOC86_000200 [Bacillus pakistanensis]|uniref:Carotenoid biosynthesis protein n=1 Tax=Rossellomorea pakistanensis TaxID=992288 RepID=A0ABS2N752_9BACI|nr:hypothetical protein [Bacillus pakistanensis]MBM7583663.1 hypothetical protein [Bacillus pakistanensis]
MTIKNQWFLNAAMIFVAWLTLPFLGLRNIKRFLPASIMIILFESLNVQIGKKRKWWVFYNKPHSFLSGEFPFNIGPFLVGSMWILKLTYGKFKQFLLLNAIVDATFTFPMVWVLKKMKIVTLVRINNFQFFIYIFYKAFLLYGIQYLFEYMKRFNRSSILSSEQNPPMIDQS